MAIIVNGVEIPTNGDFIIVNGVKVAKVVFNGVTVWEKNLNQAKSAPPFLSAGWKTITSDGWDIISFDVETGEIVYHLYGARDAGTQWINENEVIANFTVAGGSDSQAVIYIFYLPTIIETDKYSSISAATQIDLNGDFYIIEIKECSRFSNDGINWTNWTNRKYPDRSYKYAQVGFFFGAKSDSDIDMHFDFKMTNFTIT